MTAMAASAISKQRLELRADSAQGLNFCCLLFAETAAPTPHAAYGVTPVNSPLESCLGGKIGDRKDSFPGQLEEAALASRISLALKKAVEFRACSFLMRPVDG